MNNYPQAAICINKNRLKLTNDKFYFLGDDQNFEIELFNPFSYKILAKIYINNESIGAGGIVLYPGQRAYIERFLDEKNKFVFKIYEVESNNITEEAIKNNG